MVLARKEELAGASSDGFKTAAFPADIAPTKGSKTSAAWQKKVPSKGNYIEFFRYKPAHTNSWPKKNNKKWNISINM